MKSSAAQTLSELFCRLFNPQWVALLGGALAVGLVFLLSWRRGLAPIVVVLAGLVVNLYLGALSTALLLFNHEALSGLLIWGAGSLAQNGWDGAAVLWPRLAISCVAAWLRGFCCAP
jgi:iron complex transport system permease protein